MGSGKPYISRIESATCANSGETICGISLYVLNFLKNTVVDSALVIFKSCVKIIDNRDIKNNNDNIYNYYSYHVGLESCTTLEVCQKVVLPCVTAEYGVYSILQQIYPAHSGSHAQRNI